MEQMEDGMVIMLYIGWNWGNWVRFWDYGLEGRDQEGMDMAELGRRRAIGGRVWWLRRDAMDIGKYARVRIIQNIYVGFEKTLKRRDIFQER